jgi:hypothetical protein
VALTQQQVVEALATTGRIVEARTLVDWRRRGLLPKLKEKGRGQGMGKVYFWEQPNIVDQAAFVFDLGGWDTRKILLALWCCGFNTPLEELRRAWIETAEKLIYSLTRQDVANEDDAEPTTDELEDALHKIAHGVERKLRLTSRVAAPYQYIQTGLILAFSRRLPIDLDDRIDHLNEEFAALARSHARFRLMESSPLLSREAIIKLRRYLNALKIRKTIERATSDQLGKAMALWSVIVRHFEVITKLYPIDVAGGADNMGLTRGRRFQALFGPMVLAILLRLLQSPGSRELEELFESFQRGVNDLNLAVERGLRAAEFEERIAHLAPPELPGLLEKYLAAMSNRE